ncbi:pathway-specific nitrogen regulator NirA [Histoplasma capsulatum G186AR]|uniref:Pathway-specific nitrogen regulator NirA n=1 Tax=Ajellomyces capsulatus TaxID=5037 RepID=A0A8H7Z6Y7_AJECA|nr:pathway-specific nitrogen regulator NirA [Histoplasma capsulatum]QSS76082.1 pathway-specific nitrogen regulator NirA [Histoplasma capsulatum G186AR]
MEPSDLYFPVYAPLMSGVDSAMMQGRDENLKCEAGAATRPQPPVQQVQPTPPPASSPPFGPQPFQPNVVQRPWPGIQPRSRLHLQGSPETETIQTVGKPGTVLTLACLNCRAKKIKCQPEDGGCKKCKKLGIPCPGPEVDERKRPSSKRYIRELHNRIDDLEKALRESEFHRSIQAREIMTLYELNQFPSYLPSPLIRTYPENIIACLCDGRYHLDGRVKYGGPTSSLHLTVKEHEEGESWSTLSAWGARATGPPFGCRLEVDMDTQNYLLDLYWKYQHTELQVFHQGAFMRDMAAGRTGFYSKTLLYCIMACAARISPRPEIRVLVLPSDRVHRGKEPSHPGDHQCLFAEASRLLEEERENPGVTTIQSLLLLSVIYCAFSNDMAGLALTNTACRLAIEMGLHRDCSNERIPQIDMEARQITFWGCFVFDRLWGLYLGRSFFLTLDENVTVPRLSKENASLPLHSLLAGSWASLLELVGLVCESLNRNQCTMAEINILGDQLHHWYSRLDPQLYYRKDGLPSVAVMHMQYCAAIIILYRPLAGFGKVDTRKIETADKFRNICVLHAIKIAHFLADYRGFHNNATTLSGIALHIIEMACTVLISDIAERIKTTDVTNEYTYLAICVQTLLELEQTYLVAQKVRKILKKIIDICNLDLNRLKQVLAYLDARYQTSPGFSAETNVGPSSRISSANLARPDYRDSTDTRLHGHQNLSTEPHDPPPQNLHVPSSSVPDAPYHEFTEQDIFHTYELPLDQTRHFEQ